MKKILVFVIKIYRKVKYFFPVTTCRFCPSCSEYMQDSIVKYGIWKGFGKGCCRILRCNPWHPGGYDPVVDKFPRTQPKAELWVGQSEG